MILRYLPGGAIGIRSFMNAILSADFKTFSVQSMFQNDIAGRPSKHLSRFTRTRFDRVITLCDKVKDVCPEFPGRPPTAHWSIADPAASGRDDATTYPAFVSAAGDIDERIGLLIARCLLKWNYTRSGNCPKRQRGISASCSSPPAVPPRTRISE